MNRAWYPQPRVRCGQCSRVFHRAVELVVRDHMVERASLRELALGDVEPLPDLAGALGRALPEPSLELADRSRDEDRYRGCQLVGDVDRSFRLELEHRHSAGVRDSLYL